VESIDDKILRKIKRSAKGSLFFTIDFLLLGNTKAVSKALERLVKYKQLTRVARGIYCLLEYDPLLGPVKPGTEEIAVAISRRDKARIMPTGTAALNALGLSTQVPVHVVYLTDGAARKIVIGRRKIIFKKTTPKNLAATGKTSGLVIQALKEIGKESITDEEITFILQQLKKEDVKRLEHDIMLAPEWIRVIMRKALPLKRSV
jgi:hypothetical protein